MKVKAVSWRIAFSAALAAGSVSRAAVPAHPIANGTFIQDYLVRDWTDAKWQSEFRYMKELGMRYMVFGSTADSKAHKTYYPTSVPGYRQAAGYKDLVDACLRNAQKAGIRVFVSLNFHEDWWSKGGKDPAWLLAQMKDGNAIAYDLYTRYHARYPKAFYGWYWVWEVDNISFRTPEQRASLAAALDTSVRHLKSLNAAMPVMLCPFMNYRLGTPDEYRDMWKYVFAHCSLGKGDIFCPQDCVGAGGLNIDNFRKWFAALRKAVDTKPGLRFWSDAETFSQDDWTSATLDRFVRQLKGVRPYVQESITFAWSHYYSPNYVSPGWQKTYLGYVRTGALESVAPNAPKDLRAERLTNGDIRVSWGASRDNVGVAGYYVVRNGRRVSRQQATKGQGRGAAPTAFVDKEVPVATTATYTVQAYDFAGNVSKVVGPVTVPAAVQ